MDIQPLGQSTGPTRQGGVHAQAPGPAMGSDYLTFLNMLTVQMRNQDPLNPMNASDFAVQLATFSGVEQQVQTNQLLASLISRSGLGDLGNWVGMEVGVPGEAWFDGSPVALAPDAPASADRATLVVRDQSGTIVDRIDLPVDTQSFTWEGTDSDGEPLPEGRYSFMLETRTGETTNDAVPVTAYQRVNEARMQNGEIMLVLLGGLMLPAGEALGLRAPQPDESD
ncbi:MAG: flagellar hook assembly protein FlgD [Pararhodobacter sp.]|nr:flagellar hook assembly protein FlgD [Pararhodobacter sp.]